MTRTFTADLAIDILREVVVTLVRREEPALSAHQLGVFLTCYLQEDGNTVRGLAMSLGVSRSVVTRAVDKLDELGLVVQQEDPEDGRSMRIERTQRGFSMIHDLRQIAERFQTSTLMPCS